MSELYHHYYGYPIRSGIACPVTEASKRLEIWGNEATEVGLCCSHLQKSGSSVSDFFVLFQNNNDPE